MSRVETESDLISRGDNGSMGDSHLHYRKGSITISVEVKNHIIHVCNNCTSMNRKVLSVHLR